MILNEFFNSNQTESLADDFMKMAREKGYNPTLRTGPQPTKPPSTFTSNPTSSDVDRSAVQTELDQLQKQFDPDYQYSDDYTFWSKQNRIAQRMSVLKQLLAKGNQGVAETTSEDSKIGGRYTPAEFDAKLARIKARHQANPANTADLAARLQAAYKKQTPVAESRQQRKSLLKQILKG